MKNFTIIVHMRLLLLLFSLFFCGCSCQRQSTLRIGIDPQWYPLDFGAQTSYINGYTEELLLEMSKYSGLQFELVTASWDNLLDGLKKKKYDAVFTSLAPYEYNQAKFDFSSNVLDLGPVLILPAQAEETELGQMKNSFVGVLENDAPLGVLEKYPQILIRSYSSIPELLDALLQGAVQAAVLQRIPAVNYVGNLYAGKLKIVGDPLTNQGLHLIALKGERLNFFNRNLETLKKKNKLESLLKKWGLTP